MVAKTVRNMRTKWESKIREDKNRKKADKARDKEKGDKEKGEYGDTR